MALRSMLRGYSYDSVHHLAQGATVAAGGQVTGTALRYATALLAAHLLGSSGLGLYVLVLAIGGAAGTLSSLGLDRAVLRFIPYHRGRGETGETVGVFLFASLVTAMMGAVLGIVLFVGATDLARWWHEPQITSAARAVAFAIPLIGLGQIGRAGLRGVQDVRLPVVLDQMVGPLATALLLVALHVSRPTDDAVGAVAAVASWVVVGAASWLSLAIRLRRDRTVPMYRPKRWVAFSMPMWVEAALLFIVTRSGYFVLAGSVDTSAVGVYSCALGVATLVALPMASVTTAFSPTVSELHARGDLARLEELYSWATRRLLVVGLGLALLLAAAGPWLLGAFGAGFQSAYPVLLVLLGAQVLNSGTGPSGLILVMTGHTGWRLANAAAGAVLTLTLSLMFVPRWGAMGAAVAVSAATSLLNLLQVAQVRRVLGLWAYRRPTDSIRPARTGPHLSPADALGPNSAGQTPLVGTTQILSGG